MPAIVIVAIIVFGAIFYHVIHSAPYQCPQCGAIIQRYDYCHKCGWQARRRDDV